LKGDNLLAYLGITELEEQAVLADSNLIPIYDQDANIINYISAETLAAYVVAENTTTKDITFADSPYTVTALDDFISVDSSGGNVVINLLPLSTAPAKPIYIRQNDGAPNTTTITPDGNTIDGAASLPINSDGNAEMCVPFSAEWRTF
jgi:hypothetical protein